MNEGRNETMVTHEAREPLHKFLKFDIKEHERSRPGDFWESEEGLEIGIVRTRESMQFSLEYIIGCLQDLSEEIFKSVKETDTLKNVSIGARISLTRAMKGTRQIWLKMGHKRKSISKSVLQSKFR